MYEIPHNLLEAKPNVFSEKCPARFILGKVSGKWSMLIIDALQDKNLRNGELIRIIEGISQKMLTQTLRVLADLQLIERHDMRTIPPHVEYELTKLGQSLREKICSLDRWIEENMFELIENNKSIQLNVTKSA